MKSRYRNMKSTLFVLLLMWAGFSTCTSQSLLPAGSGIFHFSTHPALRGDSIRVFYHRPVGKVAEFPVLFVMHGVNRNADTYRDNWVELSEKYKILVIVPEFTKERFPGSRMYNYGNLWSKDGKLNAEQDWTYSFIDPIFEEVVRLSVSKAKQYDLFGHSAGAQFAHRFFLFKRDTKVSRVVAANAGSYTMLDTGVDFPFGVNGMEMDEDRLKSLLARDLIVQLGEEDTDPKHRNLNVTPEAMKQGAYRFERGMNFYESAKECADRLGVSFGWTLRTVAGVAHDNAGMALDIAGYLYSGNKSGSTGENRSSKTNQFFKE